MNGIILPCLSHLIASIKRTPFFTALYKPRPDSLVLYWGKKGHRFQAMFLVDTKGSCMRHTDSCKTHNVYTPAVICYFSHTNHDYGSISIYTLSIQCNSRIIVSEAMLPLQSIGFFFVNNLHLSVITSYQLSILFFSYLAFCFVTFYEIVSTVLLNWHSRKYKNVLYKNSVLLDWYKLNGFCQLQNNLQQLKITVLFRYSSNQILS